MPVNEPKGGKSMGRFFQSLYYDPFRCKKVIKTNQCSISDVQYMPLFKRVCFTGVSKVAARSLVKSLALFALGVRIAKECTGLDIMSPAPMSQLT